MGGRERLARLVRQVTSPQISSPTSFNEANESSGADQATRTAQGAALHYLMPAEFLKISNGGLKLTFARVSSARRGRGKTAISLSLSRWLPPARRLVD